MDLSMSPASTAKGLLQRPAAVKGLDPNNKTNMAFKLVNTFVFIVMAKLPQKWFFCHI